MLQATIEEHDLTPDQVLIHRIQDFPFTAYRDRYGCQLGWLTLMYLLNDEEV